jgi:pyruvate formate-lyase/glycerol dehydratase family glycyl radical enzyme
MDFNSHSLSHFPRLVGLRQAHRSAPKRIFTERAQLITDFFKRNGFSYDRMVLQRAEGLDYVLHHIPTSVFNDELIVGATGKHRLACLVFPELFAMSVWPELPTLSRRKIDPILISDEEAVMLAEEVFPFWKDHHVGEYVRRQGNNPRGNEIMETMLFYLISKATCLGHIIPGYHLLVSQGLNAMIQRAGALEKKAKDEKTALFYKAVQIAMGGVIAFAHRYAQSCDAFSLTSETDSRREELRRVAVNLRQAPAEPPQTFEQAIQAIWITQVALHQESIDAAISFGRLDQILYPFYKRDLEAGVLDVHRAAELIGCFYLKMGDHAVLIPASGHEVIGGSGTNQALTLGGLKPDGADGVNELTLLMLKMSEILGLREPNVGARIHERSSPEYWRALTESLYHNGAVPALYNDRVIIDVLCQKGVSLADAMDYGIVGCVEPTSAGRTMGHTGSILFNLVACLELALYNGRHPLPGLQIGPASGKFTDFKSFDQFYKAFKTQLAHMAELAADTNNRYAEAHKSLLPSPLLSALIEGTFEKGKDVTDGGATYNSSGVAVIGFADVVDSLLAVRQMVFDEARITPAELMKALMDNFQGHEKIHALLAHKAPKYGNDDDRADDMARELATHLDTLFSGYQNTRGGSYHVGYWSMTLHTGLGKLTGALPNGRRKGAPFASGVTPCSGSQTKGPTASLSSTAKLPHHALANGIANNHRISKLLLGRSGKRELFEQLIRGYFKKGGMQVQFIVQDKQVLLDALAYPDDYADLLVRVSGYTAYFNDLTQDMKKEIIARAEAMI